MLCLLLALVAAGCARRCTLETIRPGLRPIPWTHIPLRNDPADFQFAILADRTGGERPGVFPAALDKLNLLQPEFVLCVGDLIEGKSDDPDQIRAEHAELHDMLLARRLPFFRIPGNHDLTNDAMTRIWQEDLGRTYYHFTYRDVLFLCLNSEDPPQADKSPHFSDEQIAWLARVLKRNADVRWTLVFLHKPAWETRKDTGWAKIEPLLQDRPHTVFAGHNHTYLKTRRGDNDYYKLATTGGSSTLAGLEQGKFDHLMWVTMTDRGPIIANLLLDAIRDDNPRDDHLPPPAN
jgi:hypothetical protein